MLIPKHYRRQLWAIGYRRLFWNRIWDWAYGERYRLNGRIIVYVKSGEIVSVRKNSMILWRSQDGQSL